MKLSAESRLALDVAGFCGLASMSRWRRGKIKVSRLTFAGGEA